MSGNKRIPPGLVRCDVCGDYQGTTFEKYLARNPDAPDDPFYDPDRAVSAQCRCQGPLCKYCGVNRIHRPMSSHYHEDINMILHVPAFAGGAPCDSCASRTRQANLRATQASLGPGDRAVHVPCALRPGESSKQGGLHLFMLNPPVRMASIISMLMMPTYASLVSGVPDPESDARLILEARKRARTLWGDRPTHVIAPVYEYAVEGRRTFQRLPPVEYHAWLQSRPIEGSGKESSQLVVIWFGRCGGYVALLKYVEQTLQSLPWEKLAGGCDS
jgi:hypothetical protein